MASRKLRESEHVITVVTPGSYFNGGATGITERAEQLLETRRGNLIPRRMRQYGLATRHTYPANGFFKPRPLTRHITGLARCQKVAEHGIGITGMPRAHQMTGEMRAADQLRICVPISADFFCSQLYYSIPLIHFCP